MRAVPPDPPLADGTTALRPLDERDLPVIEEAARDSEITRWFDLPHRATDYLAAKRARWETGTGASFAICADGRCVGHVFVERDRDDGASVGYWLLAEGRGQGHAARAVGLTAPWALRALALNRVQITTDAANIASQRVAERAGISASPRSGDTVVYVLGKT